MLISGKIFKNLRFCIFELLQNRSSKYTLSLIDNCITDITAKLNIKALFEFILLED